MRVEMKVSDDELALNQIPLRARDVCAHLLLEMKRCQRREMYLPWKCEHEKHNYEACKLSEYGPKSPLSDQAVIVQLFSSHTLY